MPDTLRQYQPQLALLNFFVILHMTVDRCRRIAGKSGFQAEALIEIAMRFKSCSLSIPLVAIWPLPRCLATASPWVRPVAPQFFQGMSKGVPQVQAHTQIILALILGTSSF